jgi:hypothetical protein
MNPEQVAASFAFDSQHLDELKNLWLELIALSLWGELKSSKLGAYNRLNKRLLEVAENLRSFANDRRWIPQIREQVKGAMGAALNLRDSLQQLDLAVKVFEGGADFADFEQKYLHFRQHLLRLLEKHEFAWATLLESLYNQDAEE